MLSSIIQEIETQQTPETLTSQINKLSGTLLLRSGTMQHADRFSLVVARPFLSFKSFGSKCIIRSSNGKRTLFGNPWKLLESLSNRYELLEEIDLPFPLGGCFGYFGYEMKQFSEPRLPLTVRNDLELPECHVGFYDSVVVFDHQLNKTWLISTGMDEEGNRCSKRAHSAVEFWLKYLTSINKVKIHSNTTSQSELFNVTSTLSCDEYCNRVKEIISYIWQGDILSLIHI